MMMKTSPSGSSFARRSGRLALAAAIALALQACGGGGGDSAATGNASPGGSTSAPPASNSAPTISGTPAAQVTVGQAYSFKPSAADANNDKLTFSIANKPAWANFDTSTGTLSGTPTAAGFFSNISISVTDGLGSASLTAFNVTVNATPSSTGPGSATLSWTPPTARSDGSALTNLAGYKIRYGTSENELATLVTVDTAGVSSYVVDNLSAGTYYFVISAYDSTGAESPASAVVSKTIS
jgi:hypothetical protein